MTEIWKDIEGYGGRYQVSNMGRIRSVDFDDYSLGYKRTFKGKIKKQRALPKGYLMVCCTGYPNLYVHRAVAMAFVPGYFKGAQVNHKDENKQNNRWNNLEWVTPKENINYGSCIANIRNAAEKRAGKTICQYTLDGILVAEHPSMTAAGRAINATRQAINYALKNQRPIKGHLFKYKK